jgi:plastocyanin
VQGAHNPDNGQFYSPSTITVEPQTKIIWKNEDMAREDEIISEIQQYAVSGKRERPDPSHGEGMIPDGIFDTGFIPQGQSSLPIEMPSTPGIYPYFCILHPLEQ